MTSLDTLISELTQAFTHGTLDKVVERVQTPTTIYIGDRVVVVGEGAELVSYLTRYRQNLIDAGFARATAEIISEAITGHRRVRLNVRWVFLDSQDEIVTQLEVDYFCAQTTGTFWQIQLIQVAEPTTHKFQAGLPVD